MERQRCAEEGHLWTCITAEGDFGELETLQRLTPEGCAALERDPGLRAVVCEGGRIVCDRCQTPFSPADERPPFDYKAIKARLIRASRYR